MNEKSDCLSLDSVALREIAAALGYAKGATFEVMILAIAHLRRERAEALAACAEMRAALGGIAKSGEVSAYPARAALARTDLGAGVVVVPREVVERVTEVVGWYVDNGRGTVHGTRTAAALLADLDALLGKAGG